MRRPHVYDTARSRIDPAVGRLPTGENEGMDSFDMVDADLKIGIERSFRDGLPNRHMRRSRIDPTDHRAGFAALTRINAAACGFQLA